MLGAAEPPKFPVGPWRHIFCTEKPRALFDKRQIRQRISRPPPSPICLVELSSSTPEESQQHRVRDPVRSIWGAQTLQNPACAFSPHSVSRQERESRSTISTFLQLSSFTSPGGLSLQELEHVLDAPRQARADPPHENVPQSRQPRSTMSKSS